MKKVLAFDVETTGIPNWKIPSDSPEQPHLVQLAGILANDETGEVIEKFDFIIKPDGWEITQETIDIHGITNEHALEHGIPEPVAVQKMLDLIDEDTTRVAHNRTFDQRLVRIALKRFFTDQEMEEWARKDNFICTMWTARKHLGGKQPKLVDALKAVTGKDLEGAHNAMNDAQACLDLYFGLKSQNAIEG